MARSVASEGLIDTLAELFVIRAVSRHISNDSEPESLPRRFGRSDRRKRHRVRAPSLFGRFNLWIGVASKLRPATTSDRQNAGHRQAPNGQ